MNFYGFSNKSKTEAALVNIDEVNLIVWKEGKLDFYFRNSPTGSYFTFSEVDEEMFKSVCERLKTKDK